MFQRQRQGAVDVIGGEVPVNAENAQELESRLKEVIQRGQPRVVVNLAGVPLLDSRGLELLLDYRDHCARRGGALKLAAPNPLLRDVLIVTGADAEFEVFDDAVAAVGSFAQ